MKYTFIIYIFDVLDVDILLYKFGQIQTNLIYDKAKCLTFQDGVFHRTAHFTLMFITGSASKVYSGSENDTSEHKAHNYELTYQ